MGRELRRKQAKKEGKSLKPEVPVEKNEIKGLLIITSTVHRTYFVLQKIPLKRCRFRCSASFQKELVFYIVHGKVQNLFCHGKIAPSLAKYQLGIVYHYRVTSFLLTLLSFAFSISSTGIFEVKSNKNSLN